MFTFTIEGTLRPNELKNREKEILEQLRQNPNEVLVDLYKAHRKAFLSWAFKSYGADAEMSADCFQDAMVILYNNVREGKLTELNSSVKTYLFSIGKNLIFRKYKTEKRELPLNEATYREAKGDDVEFPELYQGNTMENKVAGLLQSMKDPCKSILRYFYFRGLSMEEIAIKMDYKNAQTVKAQKVRCIKDIQSMVKRQARTNL